MHTTIAAAISTSKFQVDFSLFSLGILIDALHVTAAEEEECPLDAKDLS